MNCIIQMVCYHQSIGKDTKKWCLSLSFIRCFFFKSMPNSCWNNSDLSIYREVINPEDMEERIVSTVLKHLSLQDTVFKLAKAENQQTEEFILLSAVIQEVYTKIDSLLRQLQVILLNLFQIYLPKYLRGFKTIHELICYYDYKFVFLPYLLYTCVWLLQTLAELEQRWHNEVVDHKEGNTTLPPFFSDFQQQEVPLTCINCLVTYTCISQIIYPPKIYAYILHLCTFVLSIL